MGTEDDHLEVRRVIAESYPVLEQLRNKLNSTPAHFQATFKHQKVDIIVATESYYSGRPTWLNHMPKTATTSYTGR